jgi:glycosyltransferase involved in cell wall biosynthesis
VTIRRRRILHVTSACTVGGCEAHVLALLGKLDPAYYELWLAYFEERPDDARPMLADFQALGVKTVDLRGHGQLDPVAAVRLLRLLWREKFDLVHTHSLRAELATVAAARLTRPRPRVVRSVHNVDDFYARPPTSWLARVSGGQLDGLVVISDAVSEHVKMHTGLPSEKVTRIYYGLDAAPYQPRERNANAGAGPAANNRPPTIGMVARLAPQKGHRVLFDALPTVIARLPNLRVEVVGHEHLTSTKELETYAQELGVGRHVSFLGFRDDLPELLAGWDVLALPSLWEGFGLVLLEAMAAGLPVVASRVGPIPEIVVHAETGLLVEPGEPEPLASALLELLEKPESAAELGIRGRRRVVERFSLERMVAETEAFYDRLLVAPQPRLVAT